VQSTEGCKSLATSSQKGSARLGVELRGGMVTLRRSQDVNLVIGLSNGNPWGEKSCSNRPAVKRGFIDRVSRAEDTDQRCRGESPKS
jgi:hypothetical protein